MRTAFISIFLIIWFVNSKLLQKIYDVTDYYGYINFVAARFSVYEFGFLVLASGCFISFSGLSKSLACFAVIMIAGSLVDKVVFGVTGYVLADILLIILAVVASVIVYRNERRFKLDRGGSELGN